MPQSARLSTGGGGGNRYLGNAQMPSALISVGLPLPCDIMVILSILLPCGKEKMMMICNLICEIKSSFRSLPGRGCLVVCETEKPKYSPYLNIVIWIKISLTVFILIITQNIA